jgi:hypothetical protein
MSGWSDHSLAVELAGLGGGLRVTEPAAVVEHLRRIAGELVAVYASDG